MASPAMRFFLHDIDYAEVRDANAFDVFEPKVVLEVEGRNAFESFGRSDSGPVVVLDFLVEALDETLRMLGNLEQGVEEGNHEFELTASLFVISLHRRREGVEVFLVDEGEDPAVSRSIGRVEVADWVEAVAALADEVLDLLQRLNPAQHGRLLEDVEDVKRLKVWLVSRTR